MDTLRCCLRGLAAAALGMGTLTCGRTEPLSPSPLAPTSAPIRSWSDEFDGPAGAPPDPGIWSYDRGGHGWGNGELQHYTDAPANARLDGQGHLLIRVERATDGGYTSARIKTQGRRLAQYGRVEARIRLPAGRGIWPAFWMLGASFDGSNWPLCGEIDIMEHRGHEPSLVHGTVHGPGYSGGRGLTATHALAGGGRLSDEFHRFAVEWRPGSITFLVDDIPYHRVSQATLPPGAAWVFDQPFFLVLNVAVGGNFAGPPDSSTVIPQEMVVDYVRYTARATDS